MNTNIREAVINNLKSSPASSLVEIVEDATTSSSETVLPGLGVFFEVLWKNSSKEEKNSIISKISSSLH